MMQVLVARVFKMVHGLWSKANVVRRRNDYARVFVSVCLFA